MARILRVPRKDTTRAIKMQHYEVSASVVKGGVATAQAKQSAIRFDGSSEQDPVLPGPAELLATAFAARALKKVERLSRILPFRHESASIRVVAEREEASAQNRQNPLHAYGQDRRTAAACEFTSPQHPQIRHRI
jgi:hypothetical protein